MRKNLLMICLLCAALCTACAANGVPPVSATSAPPPTVSPTQAAPNAQTASPAPTATESADARATETPTPAPIDDNELLVSLYLPNENADGFVIEAAYTDGTAAHIVSLLVAEDVLPAGCALLSFDIGDGKSGAADMNAAFGQSLQGTAGEYLRIGAVVNTLLTYYGLEEIMLTMEDQTIETGHSVYDTPIGFVENQTAICTGYPTAPPANDLSGAIANLPYGNALDVIWFRLLGYWTAADGLFVGFMYHDGLLGVNCGVWEAGGFDFAECIDATATGEYTVALTLRYAATEGDEIIAAREERIAEMLLDVSGLDNDGKINIQMESHGNGGAYTYAFGGFDSGAAYGSVHE